MAIVLFYFTVQNKIMVTLFILEIACVGPFLFCIKLVNLI